MITVLPLQEESRKNRLLQALPGQPSHGQVLVMCDGPEELGFAVLDLQASVLRLYQICVYGDDPGGMFADFLMRSAASYAANFGAYQIDLYDRDFFDFFCARGFTRHAECVSVPLSAIVRVHKPDS